MLKSTQDKLERQQKAQSQIEFFENQKENLKNMQCDSIEEIARKLEMFHSYEDQIAAVKKLQSGEQYHMEHLERVGAKDSYTILEGTHFIYRNNAEEICEIVKEFFNE